MAICKFFQQGYCKYGQNCRFEHVYSTKYSYRAPQKPTQQINDFQQKATKQNNVFHQKPTQQNNVFHQKPKTSDNVASSIFRSAVQNTNASQAYSQQPKVTSVFNRLGPPCKASTTNQAAQSIFSQANKNIFGQQNQVNNVQNPFTNSQFSTTMPAPAPNGQSVFGRNLNNAFSQPNNNAKILFASAAASTAFVAVSPFGNNVHQQRSEHYVNSKGNLGKHSKVEENVYSNMNILTSSDIEAYESSEFKLWSVPEIPPPRSLCV